MRAALACIKKGEYCILRGRGGTLRDRRVRPAREHMGASGELRAPRARGATQ